MKNNYQNRLMFIEIMFMVSVVVIVVGNFFFLNSIATRNSTFSKNLIVSRALAQKGMEAMVLLRNQNKPAITINSHSYTWPQLFDGTITLPSCTSLADPTVACADFILTECKEETSSHTYSCIKLNTNPYTDASWAALKEENRIFSRKIRITNAETNAKNVTSFIWWTDATGLHNSPISRKLQNTVE